MGAAAFFNEVRAHESDPQALVGFFHEAVRQDHGDAGGLGLLDGGNGRVGAGVVAVLVALVMFMGKEPNELLYSNLDLKEASQVTQALDQAGIKYETKGDGSTIMVHRDEVAVPDIAHLISRVAEDGNAREQVLASIGQDATMPQAHKDMFLYCNTVMEPWDGPAALAATDGRWVIAGLDRNGLRPLRYTVSRDAMLIVGSETGMVKLDESDIVEKGRVGPGQMIGVDLKEGKFFHDRELKDSLAAVNVKMTPELRAEIQRWDKVVKDSGAKID